MVGAVGEGSAYTFLPLVVYGIYLVFEKDVEDREFPKSWPCKYSADINQTEQHCEQCRNLTGQYMGLDQSGISARTIQDRGTIFAQILQQFWFSRIPESMEGKAGDLLNPIGVGLF